MDMIRIGVDRMIATESGGSFARNLSRCALNIAGGALIGGKSMAKAAPARSKAAAATPVIPSEARDLLTAVTRFLGLPPSE